MSSSNSIGKKAIVIGGSIAGILSARVLSDFFEEVIIVEKEKELDRPLPRKSVPQSSQGHVLLKRGEEILEELFPGIIAEMVNEGSTKSDFARDITWYHHGCRKIQYESDFSIVQQSRPFLEWHLNRRIEQYPNIKLYSGCKAKKLFITDRDEVRGLLVAKADGKLIELNGELIIDASGAASMTPQWLEELGCNRPVKSEVKIDLFYASIVYKRLSESSYDWHSLLIYPDPPRMSLGGSISPIEGGKFLVTPLSYGNPHAPSDHNSFLHFARKLNQPDLYHAIKNGVAETDAKVYRFPALRRYHYEKLTKLPEGSLVIGDAFCRIDPAFAQGMSLAAIEAVILGDLLKKHCDRKKLTDLYYRKVSRMLNVPWLIALTEDYRFLSTEGKKPFGLPFLQWYVKKVVRACSRNKRVYRQFMDVLHFKAHPVRLFKPSILKDVLFNSKTP